jgi:hypothetical protein
VCVSARGKGGAQPSNTVSVDLMCMCMWGMLLVVGSDSDKVLEGLTMTSAVREELMSNIRRRLTPQPVKIRAGACRCKQSPLSLSHTHTHTFSLLSSLSLSMSVSVCLSVHSCAFAG